MSSFEVKLKDGASPTFRKDLKPELVKGLALATQILVGEIRREINEWTSSSDDDTVRRTGALARSFHGELSTEGTDLVGKAVSDLPYARIHNEGGTITPKTAQYLTVPMKRLPVGFSARNVPDPVFIKGPSGAIILFSRVDKGLGGLDPYYALVQEVEIRAKHYLDKAAEKAEDLIAKAIDERLGIHFQVGP